MFAISGKVTNSSRKLPAFRRHALEALLLVSAGVLLTSCGKSDAQVLTAACVRAGSATHILADDTRLATTCACESQSARVHLDPDDYRLLVRFARINGESAAAQIKADELITALAGWGVSGPKATAAIIDIMSFQMHAAQECSSSIRGDV